MRFRITKVKTTSKKEKNIIVKFAWFPKIVFSEFENVKYCIWLEKYFQKQEYISKISEWGIIAGKIKQKRNFLYTK